MNGNGRKQFSVNFDKGGFIRACDWASDGIPKWLMSSRGDMECRWRFDGPLSERGRQELLNRFGLQSIAEQLPLEVIIGMSPARLAFIGEAIEGFMELRPIYQHPVIEQEHIGEHAPFSDRAGDHVSAELVTA